MKAIKNFIILFSGDGLSYLLNFFTTIYLARNLEVSNFGKISFAFAFFAFGSFLTNFGLISIGTRDIAQKQKPINPEIQEKYISNVINLRQCLAIIAFILLLLITFFIHKPLSTKYLIIIYGLSLFPFAMLLEWVFFGWEKMTYITVEKILFASSYFVLILLFVKKPHRLTSVPLTFLISNLLSVLFLLLVYRFDRKINLTHTYRLFRIQFNIKEWLYLLKSALPIGLGAILIQFSTNFNTVFLGLVKSDIQVGLFSAANKLLFFILIFDRVMNNTTFPIISRYYVTNKEKLFDITNRLSKIVLLLSIPICVGGFILAPDIIKFLYGNIYADATIILKILIWFFLITILNSLYTSILIAGKKNKQYLTAISLGVFSNVILSIVLVPLLGAIGTSISIIFAELVTLILLGQLIKPIITIRFPFLNIIRPIFATGIMVLVIKTLYSRISIILLIILSAIAYCLILVIINGIHKSDFTLSKIS